MTILRIEHAISDLATWQAAFDRFADARTRAGVRGQRIHQPVDDANYICLDLDFDTPGQAEAFANFLHTTVWATPANAPALVGTPHTRILQPLSAD